MKTLVVGIVVLLHAAPGSAFQGESWSAHSRALASIQSTLRSGPSCLGGNCAGLVTIRDIHLAVSATPSLYGLSELATRMFFVTVPTRFGTIGAGHRQFGYELYRESSWLVGAGFTPGSDVAAGIGMELRTIAIKGYGSESVALVRVGLQTPVGSETVLSGVISNLLGATLGKDRERLPRSVSVGCGYSPGAFVTVFGEIEKDSRNPEALKFGVEFVPVSSLAVRGGVRSNPAEWSFGMSCEAGPLSFGYGGTFHGQLGWTHQVDLALRMAL